MRSAASKVEALRRKQNEHLLAILEEEQLAETARENKLRKARDHKERERLQQKFDAERADASERIIRITVSQIASLSRRRLTGSYVIGGK